MTNTMKVYSERPYYDDYDADKGFLQVLFRPALAVQARELTQMQTILQDQIARVGGHFFDNGARIINGETKLWNRIQYIKFPVDFVPSSNHDYSKCTIKKTGTELSARVVHFVDKTSTDPFTVYVEYFKSAEETVSFETSDSLEITVLNTDNNLDFVISGVAALEVGYGAIFSINSGIYFINSRFVLVNKQTIVLSKYENITESVGSEINIGFKITDVVVGPETDPSLFDNAVGSTNESAPGATRYKMEVDLVLRSELTDDEINRYIQLLIVKKGIATETPNLTDYNKTFLELFARRTYDESGDYVVNDFLLDIREHLNDLTNRGLYTLAEGGDETKISLSLDSGKAYVRGFEVSTQVNTLLETDKARTFALADETYISMPFESYVLTTIDNTIDTDNSIPSNIFYNVAGRESANVLYFKNSSNVTLYTASPVSIENVSGNRFKIKFGNLVPISTNPRTSDVTIITNHETIGSASMKGRNSLITISTANTKLLYKLPYSYVKNFTDANFIEYKVNSASVTDLGSNVFELTLNPGAGTVIGGTDNYVISLPLEEKMGTVTNVDADNRVVTFTLPSGHGVSTGSTAYVVFKVFRNEPTVASKILTTVTDPRFAIKNNTRIKLQKCDGFKLISVISRGIDYTDSYTFDNGQRDDVYDHCYLNSNGGTLPPNGSLVDITYQYFNHTSGDFFTVDSYLNNSFAYDDIPLYKTEFLGNFVDLRKAIDITQSNIATDELFIADYSFYLARKDKIILSKNGQFNVLKGVPSLTPQSPTDADDSITLYELTIPAFTFNTSDISASKLNYKRYTMKDIAQIERRVEDLEYYTSLSLLETDIQGKEFFDKFKSGFIVDNFESLTTADAESPLHTVAIDFVNNELRPEVVVNAINVEPDTYYNCVNHNGIITLKYTETMMITQSLASIVERIQPFTKYNWVGKIRLNPSFDNWITTKFIDLTLDNGTFPASKRGEVLNNVWDSVGRFFLGNPVNATSNQSARLQTAGNAQVPSGDTRIGYDRSRHANAWARPVVTTQTQFVGSRLVDVGAVPFIRSRVVEFNATGLKPNTKVKSYFDGVDITGYTANTVISQIYDGTSTDPLISDGAGELHGYFYIRNDESVRFKTGSKRFEVYDAATNPSTSAEGTYIANGTNFTMQNVFVTTRFVDTETVWYDPVAQSFTVENPDGAFITSVDLYFGTSASDNTDPVKVQIRDMKNGFPSDNTVAETIMYAGDIIGSNNSAVATRFTFNNPIFLESGKEYCFVVITNSTDLTIWSSKLGEKDMLTGQYINKQPYLGSMFKSQNNKTWTPEQLQDIKFTINRAKFDISADSECFFFNRVNVNDVNTEADPFHKILDNNPFSANNAINISVTNGGSGYITAPTIAFTVDTGIAPTGTVILGSGATANMVVGVTINTYGGGYSKINSATISSLSGSGAVVTATGNSTQKILVSHKNHGFVVNDTVTISGATSTSASYPDAVLNGTHTIVDVPNIDAYVIAPTPSVINTENIIMGGGSVLVNQNISYSGIRLLSDAIAPNGTEVSWKLKPRTVHTTALDVNEIGFIEGSVLEIGTSKIIKSGDHQTLVLKGSMISNSDFLSPVIDAERLTVYTYTNRISAFKDKVKDANGDDTDVDTYNAKTRYLSKQVTLINPANELQVYLDNNMPTGTGIDVYCKVGVDQVSLYDTNPWNKLRIVSGGVFSDKNEFTETKYLFDNVSDFSNFIIKIVFYSTSKDISTDAKFRAVVPRSKRLRGIALKTGA